MSKLGSLIIVLVASACTQGLEPALDGLGDVGPTFVEPADLGTGGLILNRLTAAVSGDATTADLEAALVSVDGQIASSRPGFGWITVTIPAQADQAGVEAVADTLAAQPGVLLVRPTWLIEAPELPDSDAGANLAPPGGGGDFNTYLDQQRFFGAWNARALATHKVPVYVGDHYTRTVPLEQITAQRFANASEPFITPEKSGVVGGNHGFWVSSILGADADATAPSGSHPDPETTLDLVSVQLKNLGGWVDLFHELDRAIPDGALAVLNTSLVSIPTEGFFDTSVAGLAWREVLARRATPFCHFTASGNEGYASVERARDASPFTLQASYDDMNPALNGTPVAASFRATWDDAQARLGDKITTRQGTTVIVGASDRQGAKAAFSNFTNDIRMIGTDMLGVCDQPDPSCNASGLMTANGTSGASPLAAGLGAWLAAIDPTLTAEELATVVRGAFDGRWADALSATLALEARGVPVRRTLLDLDEDGDFDNLDIELALLSFDTTTSQAPDPSVAFPDWDRADFNGDGYARPDTRAHIDLDGDGTLGVVQIEVPGQEVTITDTVLLDESLVSDLDFLCWGAFAGPLSAGTDAEARDDLLRGRCATSQPSIVLLQLQATSTSRIYVEPEFSGEPQGDADFSRSRNEGELVPDNDLVWTTVPPAGGFTLASQLGSTVNGRLPCISPPGLCFDVDGVSYDGEAASQVMWTCDDTLGFGASTCTFRLEGAATATTANAGDPPPFTFAVANANTSTVTRLIMNFRIDRPTRYNLHTTTTFPPRSGTAPGLAFFSQDAWVGLDNVTRQDPGRISITNFLHRGRSGNIGFDTTGGAVTSEGNDEGLLEPGVLRIEMEVRFDVVSDDAHTLGGEGAIDVGITFTEQ